MLPYSVVLLGVLLWASGGDCIKCYVCNSNLQPSCGVQMNKSGVVATDCSRHYALPEGSDFICQKIQVQGLSLYCFNCDTKTNPKCEDPLDEAWVVFLECSQKNFKSLLHRTAITSPRVNAAFKAYPVLDESKVTCQKLVVKDGDDAVVYRSCSMSHIGSVSTCDQHRLSLGNASVLFCDQCTSRLCNASGVLTASLMPLLLTAVLVSFV